MGIDYDSVLIFGWEADMVTIQKWMTDNPEIIKTWMKENEFEDIEDENVYIIDLVEFFSYEQDDWSFNIHVASPWFDSHIKDRMFYFGILFENKTIEVEEMQKIIQIKDQSWYPKVLEWAMTFGAKGNPKIISSPNVW